MWMALVTPVDADTVYNPVFVSADYNKETGLTWLNRFHSRFEKMVWFNPIPESMWEYDWGWQTIQMIGSVVDMYQLTIEGLSRGLKKLVSAR